MSKELANEIRSVRADLFVAAREEVPGFVKGFSTFSKCKQGDVQSFPISSCFG